MSRQNSLKRKNIKDNPCDHEEELEKRKKSKESYFYCYKCNNIILIDKANSSYKPSFDSKDTLHIYSSHTKCDKTFYYRYEKQDFIDDIVNGIVPKYFLNKFLVPEVNEAIGFEFSELHALNYLFDELDDKHKYLKIIYDSYIENDEYYLSDSQRELAFNEYKKYRDIYNK